MKANKLPDWLIWSMIPFMLLATLSGILSKQGGGPFEYLTIRGERVMIYGKGVYRHMGADVAIQGIAQDYITLLVALPLMLAGWYGARKGKLTGTLLLPGTLLYIFLTYLFYTAMATYNEMFLVYVCILGLSLYALLVALFDIPYQKVQNLLAPMSGVKWASRFLMINAGIMASLWLSIIVPPLLDGSLYPLAIQHYTTMIVQGFDLGIFLPMAFVVSILALQKHPLGMAFLVVYLIFLSVLMTALCSKIVFIALDGGNVIPAVFIIPVIGFLAIFFTLRFLRIFHEKDKHIL